MRWQFDWLLRRDPHYLLTFPSNLAALIEYSRNDGRRLTKLQQVRTVGETVSAHLRAAVFENWGVPLVDAYSSNELGYLALQCPLSGQYHVMSESVLLEVLNERGEVCQPGEVGRVVVTSLHNFATPLIRYELGDYAEQGEPCACGRGLPTLARIVGRVRNLVTLPDGQRHWPMVGFAGYRDVAPISQYQLVQTTRECIEVRLVVERTLSADEEASLTKLIHDSLNYPFSLSFRYYDRAIPRGPGHKFEEFVSLL